ncbi:UNVERIFIED_CONTAM: hypothetical protein GTU68_052811 [Idotea baltica]|nr:hypothetical protein [Idotea baltica]
MSKREVSILVVDDDRDARELLKISLTQFASTIIEADDGTTALEECEKMLPDLIVTDIMMPKMTGTEFVEKLRQLHPDKFIPVLMLTALGEVDEKVEGLTAGADDYLTKPFHFSELCARVQALLRVKSLTEQLEKYASELEGLNLALSKAQEEIVQKERQLVGVQLAGTAAHSLGQPVTAILLNCRMLHTVMDEHGSKEERQSLDAIEKECRVIKDIVVKLRSVDMNQTQDYLGETKILDIDSSDKKQIVKP